jgi:ADP-ribose pyrophosphatase YjhB (NUDIX family)
MKPNDSMIRVIAICVFRSGNRILVSEGFDSVKKETFARPLGGGIEAGETSSEALIREIREEIAQEIMGLQLLGVLENLFTYEGKRNHEIVFVYDAQFVDSALYDCKEIPISESGWTSPAHWRLISSFGPDCRLVPEGLEPLLNRLPNEPSLG